MSIVCRTGEGACQGVSMSAPVECMTDTMAVSLWRRQMLDACRPATASCVTCNYADACVCVNNNYKLFHQYAICSNRFPLRFYVHYLFLQATPLFPHDVTSVLVSFTWTVFSSSFLSAALLRSHSFVYFTVHETCSIFLSPFISKASKHLSSFILSVQLSQPYVATSHTSTFISRIFIEKISML